MSSPDAIDDLLGPEPPPRLLSPRAVRARTSLSQSPPYLLLRKGEFPKPVNVTEGRIAFVESEVDRWIVERVKARG